MRRALDRHFSAASGRFEAHLPGDQCAALREICRNAGRRETGGVLVGSYSKDLRVALISEVVGPAADSVGGRYTFSRGVKGLGARLLQLWKARKYYLGEWHYHPYASPAPSPQDARQMFDIASSERAKCPEALLIVVGGDPESDLMLHVELFTRAGERHLLPERHTDAASPGGRPGA